jgi:hypothetical protein
MLNQLDLVLSVPGHAVCIWFLKRQCLCAQVVHVAVVVFIDDGNLLATEQQGTQSINQSQSIIQSIARKIELRKRMKE